MQAHGQGLEWILLMCSHLYWSLRLKQKCQATMAVSLLWEPQSLSQNSFLSQDAGLSCKEHN